VARLGVGGVFIYAGCSKMGDLEAFAELVARYDMLPTAFVRPFCRHFALSRGYPPPVPPLHLQGRA